VPGHGIDLRRPVEDVAVAERPTLSDTTEQAGPQRRYCIAVDFNEGRSAQRAFSVPAAIGISR